MKFYKNFITFISTLFFSGFLSKKAPGTVGSLIASFLSILLVFCKIKSHFLTISVVTFVVGVMSNHVYLFKINKKSNKDPSYIVIDEATGVFVGCYVLFLFDILTLLNIAINFFVFRLFDILKPFPIKNIEEFCKKYKSTTSIGIMIDDVVAAVIGTLIQVFVYNLINR